MSLQFISVKNGGSTSLDSKDRRLIRSHVMRGRNAGKSRPSPQQLEPTKRVLVRYDCLGCSEPLTARRVHTCACYGQTLDMRQLIWDDLAMVSVPYQLDKRLRGLIHQCFMVATQALYPPKFCSPDDSMMSPWIQYVFQDEAYLQCLLAIVASYGDYFAGRPCVSPRALGYLSRAYKLVNQRLSSPEPASITTIATVTNLAIYQRIHHSQELGMVHFEGLQTLIRVHGGMAILAAENRAIAQKPWRLDIDFALQDGSPVRFCGGDVPRSVYPTKMQPATDINPEKLGVHLPEIDLTLFFVAADIKDFTNLLNSVGNDNKLNQLDFAQHVQYLLYRLLGFAPLSSSPRLTRSENLLHLALIAAMVTLLHEYGRQHSRYDLLAARLREVLQGTLPHEPGLEELILWAAFISGISVLEARDDEWLLPLIQLQCQKLGLRDWGQVRKKLRGFVWIRSTFESPAKRLCDQAACVGDI